MDFAVVLTHNRPEMLAETFEAVSPQVDRVLIIDNASDPPVEKHRYMPNGKVYQVADQPPNLARLWNFALDKIGQMSLPPGGDHHDVAFLCDDTDVPPNWFDSVRFTMHSYGCAAASTHQAQPIPSPIVKRAPDADIWNRMAGHAFILCGRYGIRADDRMHWWWLDSDLDRVARRAAGMVLVPGPIATNRQPNHWTNAKPELGEQAGRDREAFRSKWGDVPWG